EAAAAIYFPARGRFARSRVAPRATSGHASPSESVPPSGWQEERSLFLSFFGFSAMPPMLAIQNSRSWTFKSRNPKLPRMAKVTYFLEVISSWCYWAEPTWAELKRRYEGKALFDWKIAHMPAEA